MSAIARGIGAARDGRPDQRRHRSNQQFEFHPIPGCAVTI
jgi:hypothetical protein